MLRSVQTIDFFIKFHLWYFGSSVKLQPRKIEHSSQLLVSSSPTIWYLCHGGSITPDNEQQIPKGLPKAPTPTFRIVNCQDARALPKLYSC